MKIITILGARPQFIKAATVSRAIAEHNKKNSSRTIQEIIVHTGQHFDANMSEIFFEQMEIPRPNHNLHISNLSHGAMTGKMLEGIEQLIQSEQPDWVLVYGDTNSTLAGSLAAAKLHVPVAHVEAGLRSFNLVMPEEINRTLTDRISTILFCPTQTAEDNLKAEGYPFALPQQRQQQIVNVGDVMYDATLFYQQHAKESIDLEQWGLSEKGYALCTIHRAENTDNPQRLEAIFKSLNHISQQIPVVLPLHPRTRNLLIAQGKEPWLSQLKLLDPQPYLEIQRLEMGAQLILTDSGGMQKEAFFHQVPCITLRDETEWVETVNMGWNQIVGANELDITNAFNHKAINIKRITNEQQPYGNGEAASKIVKKIIQ